jgi:hypothetical protein
MLEEICEVVLGLNKDERRKLKEKRKGKCRALSPPPLSSPTTPATIRPPAHESYCYQFEDDGGADYGGGDEVAVELEKHSNREVESKESHCDKDGKDGDSNEDERRSSIGFVNREDRDQPGIGEEVIEHDLEESAVEGGRVVVVVEEEGRVLRK